MKRWRPKKGATGMRDRGLKVVGFWATPEEHRLLRGAAGVLSVPMSKYIRNEVLRAAADLMAKKERPKAK